MIVTFMKYRALVLIRIPDVLEKSINNKIKNQAIDFAEIPILLVPNVI